MSDSFGFLLRQMQDRLLRLDRRRPSYGALPPLVERWPGLQALAPDALARLTCSDCLGGGLQEHDEANPEQWPCELCGGSGLVCPVCRGRRWLRTHASCKGSPALDRLIMRCPDCGTLEHEGDAIIGFIEQHTRGQAVPV